jgi:hypothetical protein
MNKYDIINNIIVNLDSVQVQGIAAMNALVNTVRDLNTLAQMLQQEDEAKAKENGGEDHQSEEPQAE